MKRRRQHKPSVQADKKEETAKTIRVECPKHGLQELNAIVFAGVALDCGCVWIHTTGGWVLEESEKGAKSQ